MLQLYNTSIPADQSVCTGILSPNGGWGDFAYSLLRWCKILADVNSKSVYHLVIREECKYLSRVQLLNCSFLLPHAHAHSNDTHQQYQKAAQKQCRVSYAVSAAATDAGAAAAAAAGAGAIAL
ncbi:conserved hypothetical protein [Trichinella spiralis]|uniref:hypothetical protein n=1 Tax=Trichinella spiralis TaxID=6334 RepID=UPI0001EFBF81|nr:conserved hypothetical protein [Trichinella spiralis]